MQQTEAIFHAAHLQFAERRKISLTVSPNFERYPPDCCQRPLPRAANFTRMPIVGRTPSFSAVFRISSSSVYFSTTGMILRPILKRHHGGFDELGVLEAVADDRRVVLGHGHDGQQLGLAAGLDSELIRLAEVQHFFDDLTLLVHLDRIDAAVAAPVAVVGDGAGKRPVNLGQTMLQDVGKTDQDGQVDPAHLQPVDQLLQVDGAIGVFAGVYPHVAFLADREVALAPAGNVIHLGGVVNRPTSDLLIEHGMPSPDRNGQYCGTENPRTA